MFKIKRLDLSLGISAILLYFITRLYNIMSLPIFTDEAIYTRWSQIARFDPNWRFISLTDGKQPLFVWIDMILMKFTSDPLLAGRLVSVLAGFIAMVGIFFLAKELFGKRAGFIASFLYVFYPFALVYDRMALYDSLVAAGAVWALFFEILLVKKRRLDIALILGMILGASVLTKTSGFLFIYMIPFSLILFNFGKKYKNELLKWVILAGVSVGFAYFYYSILRLSPFLYIIDEKNSIFVYPFKEWLTHPLEFFFGNFSGQFNWLATYMTGPVLALVFLAFFLKTSHLREKLLLLSWFIFPFIALALFGRVLYPRFILFMTIPLLVLAAYSLDQMFAGIKFRKYKVILFLVFAALMIRTEYFIITDFARAPLPHQDLDQYISHWPAGGGVKEIINYLDMQSREGKIYVASLGTFGSLPTYAVEIYLGDNKNVEKRGIFPVPDIIPQDLLDKAKDMKVYVFFSNQSEQFEDKIKSWPLKQILEYRKGIGKVYSRLYEVEI